MKVAALIFCTLSIGCANLPELHCDREKVVTEWEQWEIEVRDILCCETSVCGDPDEGTGYGFTVGLFHDGLTPCIAAERIIEKRKHP